MCVNDQKTSKRKTAGQTSYDLFLKELYDPKLRPHNSEVEKEAQKNYMDNVVICIQENEKHYDKGFFIVVNTKRELLMPNIIRNQFFARKTCPTPTYDQTVFFYNKEDRSLDYVWTVPAKEVCIQFKENALSMQSEAKELLQFVLDFYDGTLDILCKKMNNEEERSLMLIKG